MTQADLRTGQVHRPGGRHGHGDQRAAQIHDGRLETDERGGAGDLATGDLSAGAEPDAEAVDVLAKNREFLEGMLSKDAEKGPGDDRAIALSSGRRLARDGQASEARPCSRAL